ncbi:MAG TPA: hypothetical protein VEZ11_14430 [Thermoanaerobaculia bacterium]|nr:hypothetical protein [Thermoanaerobaculia bacterium]
MTFDHSIRLTFLILAMATSAVLAQQPPTPPPADTAAPPLARSATTLTTGDSEHQLSLWPRPVYPADYKPSPCAPANSCESFPPANFKSAAFSFLGLNLDEVWLGDHYDGLLRLFAPYCSKQATCLGTAGNASAFCNDVLAFELRDAVARAFPRSKSPRDWEQAEFFMEVFALGVDQQALKKWEAAQPCVAALPKAQHIKPLDAWMFPASIPRDYKDWIRVFTIDPDTHVPIYAEILVEGKTVYTSTNTIGVWASTYPIKMPVKFIRVPDADGHRGLRAPELTVHADGYPDLKFPLPVAIPRMTVSLNPRPSELRPGRNRITVTAKDAETGAPVEARVMIGDDIAGEANTPFDWVFAKGKRPEIWATSLFDAYPDAIVAKGERASR